MPRSRAAIGLNSSPARPASRTPTIMPTSGGRPRPPSFTMPMPPGLAGDVDVADGADGEEEGVRQGQLAGGADQQVQPDGADDRAEHREPGAQPELVHVERGEQQDSTSRTAMHDQPDPRAARGAGGAGRPASRRGSAWRWTQTRVSSFVPNRPDGRTSSTTIITTYGDDVAEPAAEEQQLVLVAGGQGLGEADQQPADQRAAGRVQAAEDRGREGAQRDGVRPPGSRPGVGAPTRNSAATAARAPATIQASAETRPSRMPISAAVSPSSAEARIATPQLEYLNAAKNTAMSTPGDDRWRSAGSG